MKTIIVNYPFLKTKDNHIFVAVISHMYMDYKTRCEHGDIGDNDRGRTLVLFNRVFSAIKTIEGKDNTDLDTLDELARLAESTNIANLFAELFKETRYNIKYSGSSYFLTNSEKADIKRIENFQELSQTEFKHS